MDPMKDLVEMLRKINSKIGTINETTETNAQIQQQLKDMSNELKAKTMDLSLNKDTENNIKILIQKLDKLSKTEHEFKARLEAGDMKSIANAVSKSLEDKIPKNINEKLDKDSEAIHKATNDLKKRLSQLDNQLEQTKTHKKWFITAFIAMIIFSAVMIVFTSLANMPFLEHAYQFIATKIEHSKTWYVTGLWYIAYLITPLCWVGVVTGVAYLLHRWYTD